MENNNQNYQEKINQKLNKAFKQEEKSIVGFFIKNYRFTYLLLFAIILLGVYSLLTIPKEAEPEVKVPYAVVTTVYPGATPTDMEELVTEKIEEKIDSLDNLKEYNSSSGKGISSIFVEFEAEADLDKSIDELKDKVDEAENELPEEAETPIVTDINFNDIPIITYSLTGDYDYVELKKHADKIETELKKIKGVSEVDIIGGLEREFQIIVNQTKLKQYSLSLGNIINAIQGANFDLPAGDIEINNFKYNIRIKGKFENSADLHKVVISTFNNSPVMLGDIAQIIDDFKEAESESKIGFQNTASQKTISLQIRKKTGGNILNIVKQANEIINDKNIIPDNLIIVTTNDNSKYIKEDISTLGVSAIETIILITLILLMILSFRGAIITALTVPIAFFMSFFILQSMDMTINSMVLFSLVLSLGLMVDNAIVIIEGINEYVSDHKKSIYEAAILSVWNFKWAIISGTMTTIAAFVGLFLVSGIMGEYLSIIPKTLITTLFSSLFVALVLIPTLSTRFIKTSQMNNNGGGGHRNARRHLFIENNMKKLQKKYTAFLKNILPSKTKRRLLIATAWIAFITTATMPFLGLMKIQMFPVIDFDFFNVNIELPIGSSLETTKKISEEIEKIVAQIPEMDNYVINNGMQSSGNDLGGSSFSSHLSSITVNLINEKLREKSSYEISKELRTKLKSIQGATVTVADQEAGPPGGSPLEIKIFGDNLQKISSIAKKITNYFENIQGIINVENSIQNSAGEFTFTIDKNKANYYGLSVSQIAGTLRNAIYGTKASTVNISDEDVDITVKYAKSEFNSINDLENILLFTEKGDIPIKEIANIKIEPALLSISHKNGEKIITVTGDTEDNVDLVTVTKEFEEWQKNNIELDKDTYIKTGGEVEDINKSFTEMFASVIIAIILIYTILVLMFNSFTQPFIIVFSLPLAIPGVIIGLTALNQSFSITAFIGIVALAGIVVNDSIVLIDRINKNIKDGLEFNEAIIEGGVARMQPIFVTSLTTITGIFPLYFSNEMWRGLSVTVMTGLAFSTILTLIIIPVMYAGLCKKKCIEKTT